MLAAAVALAGLAGCGEDTGNGAAPQSAPAKNTTVAPAKTSTSAAATHKSTYHNGGGY